jgi:very-short-patch-repair endonuclease
VTAAQQLVGQWLTELGYKVEYERQVVLGRRFAWDIAVPEARIAIEIDGYHNGRHGKGWGSDNEKQNIGTMNGWRVLRFSNADVLGKKQVAYEFIQQYFA